MAGVGEARAAAVGGSRGREGAGRAVRDVALSGVPQAVAAAAAFGTSALVARGLGPAGMGQFALISSVAGFGGVLSDLGISNTAVFWASRSAAAGDEEGRRSFLRWAFRARLALVAALSAALFLAIPAVSRGLWGVGEIAPLMRLALLIGVFSVVASVPALHFLSLRRFGLNSAVSVGQTLLVFAGILAVAAAGAWSLGAVVGVSVAAAGVAALGAQLLLPRGVAWDRAEAARLAAAGPAALLRPPARRDAGLAGGPGRFAVSMIALSAIAQLTLRADVWMVGALLDPAEVGRYSVAFKTALPLSLAIGAVGTALWPRVGALAGRAEAAAFLRRALRLAALAGAAGLVYAAIVPSLVPWVFGPAYAGSVLPARVLCVRFCLGFLMAPLGVIGLSVGLVRHLWWVNLVQLAAVVGLNFLLLPRVGAVGAALSLVGYELLGGLLIGTLLWRALSAVDPDAGAGPGAGGATAGEGAR